MGRLGLTLTARTTSLVFLVKDFGLIARKAFAGKDVVEEFQECGLSGTSLPNKKNGVWRLSVVL